MAAVNPYCPRIIVLTPDKDKSSLITNIAQRVLPIDKDAILEFDPTRGMNPLDSINKLPFVKDLSKDTTALLIFIDKVIALDDKAKYFSDFYHDLKSFLQDRVACLATILLDSGVKNSDEDNIAKQILSTTTSSAKKFQEKANGSNLPRLCLDEGTQLQPKPQERLMSVLELFREAIQ